MNENAKRMAEDFLNNETQFHLGMLPTEQSNPKTRDLDKVFARNAAEGVKLLLSVDYDIIPMAKKMFKSEQFAKLVETGYETLTSGGRIIFSGCGATGRISIIMESAWRRFFADLREGRPEVYEKVKDFENRVFSIMTGGDYALVKSVECFEDFAELGREQVRQYNANSRDMLVAITEGGETSSVLGTVDEFLNRGGKVFLLFNNPADILCKYIERSRKAIEDPRVTVLDLYCCPMAIAGSTRMQATTCEQMTAEYAQECWIKRYFKERLTAVEYESFKWVDYDPAEALNANIDAIRRDDNAESIAKLLKTEVEIYKAHGLVTYYADAFLFDIFTDTTERSPTFMLPAFKKHDDATAVPSWAFVKCPLGTTAETWRRQMCRDLRCLDWTPDDYRRMNIPDFIVDNPPAISAAELLRFQVGNEFDGERVSRHPAVAITINGEIENRTVDKFNWEMAKYAPKFDKTYKLWIGGKTNHAEADFFVRAETPNSPLHLMDKLLAKLVLNTMSSGTMVLFGRISGNWMNYVQVSNKKLRDRGIRLVVELCGVDYKTACYALHETMEEYSHKDFSGRELPALVQITIDRVGRKN
ncbi:MAG: hypothetical protein PHI85_03365 [Victivallaceae bacterium]|nr:hypothetical protein [Victivallaceae bacterium]